MITIIIPVYNVEQYLRQCIESVLNQTYKNFELVLVDDGSKDNSGKICEEYQIRNPRVKAIHQKNSGEGEARNTGLRASSGEWVTFLDSDDYLDKDYLEQLAKHIDDSSLVMSGLRKVSLEKSEELTLSPGTLHFRNPAELIRKYRFNTLGYVAGKLYKTDVIKNFDLRFSAIKLKADQLFFFRYLSHISSISVLNYCGYNYRLLEQSMSHRKMSFDLHLSLVMDFYHAIKTTEIDIETQKLLLANCLDGPIGHLYEGEYCRIERLNKMKSIDKDVYRETEITNSWKSRILLFLFCHGFYRIFDINMVRNRNKRK